MCVCVRARERVCPSSVCADGRTKSGARASAQSASVHLPAQKLNCRDTRRRFVAYQHGTVKQRILIPTCSLSPSSSTLLPDSPSSAPPYLCMSLLSPAFSYWVRPHLSPSICDAMLTPPRPVGPIWTLHKNTQVLDPLSKRLRLRIGSYLIQHKFDSSLLRLPSSDVMRVCAVVAECYNVSECVHE